MQAQEASMGDRLQGRVAVITGSDSGIGQAIAIEFAREGADVAITWLHDESGAQQTRDEVERAGRRALVLQTDVRDPPAVDRLFAAAQRELGVPYVLVNDAGIGGSPTPRTPTGTTCSRPISTARSTAAGSSYGCARRTAGGGKSSISARCTRIS
jgi:glucose 1-dehydrogenase